MQDDCEYTGKWNTTTARCWDELDVLTSLWMTKGSWRSQLACLVLEKIYPNQFFIVGTSSTPAPDCVRDPFRARSVVSTSLNRNSSTVIWRVLVSFISIYTKSA